MMIRELNSVILIDAFPLEICDSVEPRNYAKNLTENTEAKRLCVRLLSVLVSVDWEKKKRKLIIGICIAMKLINQKGPDAFRASTRQCDRCVHINQWRHRVFCTVFHCPQPTLPKESFTREELFDQGQRG